MAEKRVMLIGGGNMGRSLLRGILNAGWTPADHVTVVDVDEALLRGVEAEFGVQVSTDAPASLPPQDVIILAVKPFILNDVLDALKPVVTSTQLFLSIVAGVEGAHIRDRLAAGNPVIRCMPNICATVDAAASAYAACGSVEQEHLDIASAIFGSVGKAVRVEERCIDAVTGLSGSGPAYIFLVIEALSDGGLRMGLPRDVATQLAIQTVLGAAKMVQDSGEHPAVLRDRVSTPGGTTIAGLAELEKRGLRSALIGAVSKATKQAQKLNRDAKRKPSS